MKPPRLCIPSILISAALFTLVVLGVVACRIVDLKLDVKEVEVPIRKDGAPILP